MQIETYLAQIEAPYMEVVVSRGGSLGGRSAGGDDPLLPPLLLLPLDPEEPLPATL